MTGKAIQRAGTKRGRRQINLFESITRAICGKLSASTETKPSGDGSAKHAYPPDRKCFIETKPRDRNRHMKPSSSGGPMPKTGCIPAVGQSAPLGLRSVHSLRVVSNALFFRGPNWVNRETAGGHRRLDQRKAEERQLCAFGDPRTGQVRSAVTSGPPQAIYCLHRKAAKKLA